MSESNKIEKTVGMSDNSHETNGMLLQAGISLCAQRNKLILGQSILIMGQDDLIRGQEILLKKRQNYIEELHNIMFEYSTIVDMLLIKLQENGMDKSDIQIMFNPKSFPHIYNRQTIIQNSNVRKQDISNKQDISLQNTGQLKRPRT
jgi:hypothetical protein